MLNGGNTALLATVDGRWVMLQFLNAEEVENDRWQLSGLLRGQHGTEMEAREPRPAGTQFILQDRAVSPLGLKRQEVAWSLNWRIGTSGEDFTDRFYTPVAAVGGLRTLPLEPGHVRVYGEANGDPAILLDQTRANRCRQLARNGHGTRRAEGNLSHQGSCWRLVISADVAGPSLIYSLSQRRDDLGHADADFDFDVAMISAVTGAVRSAHLAIRQNTLKYM